MRDSIEFLVHAHRCHTRPELQALWQSKRDRPEEWKKEFIEIKRQRLFEGLPLLYEQWCQCSETGSHANLSSLMGKLRVTNDEQTVTYELDYHGGEQGNLLILSLHVLALTCFLMEDVFFTDMRTRLQFDQSLVSHREAIAAERFLLGQWVTSLFDVDSFEDKQ